MIIKDAEIWYIKLDPKRPNSTFDAENPTWEIQIRTRNPETAAIWRASNLNVKDVIPTEAGVPPYHRVNLKKKIKKKDGTPAKTVACLNGHLEALDPNTVGNGSVANVRIFQREYKKVGESHDSIANMLMSVQVTTHLVYTPKFDPADDFAMTETETVAPAPDKSFDEKLLTEPVSPGIAPTPSAAASATSTEIPFVEPPQTPAVAAVSIPSPSPTPSPESAPAPSPAELAAALAMIAANKASTVPEAAIAVKTPEPVAAPVIATPADDGQIY